MSGPASNDTVSLPSPQRTFASGIVHDEETQTRSIPQSRRADGTLRKERKVKPGYTPQEDIARFRSKRLIEEDARRAASGSGSGVPGSASWVAAATSSEAAAGSSRESSGRYSSTLVGLKPRASTKESGAVGKSTPLPAEWASGSETRIEQSVRADEPDVIATSSDSTGASVSPAASLSAARAAPPRGLFARALGGVTTQDRLKEGRSTPAKDATPARPLDKNTDASAKTATTAQTPKAVQENKRGGPPDRRVGPRVPPSSASEAQSWRRGPAPATLPVKSASSGTRDANAAQEIEVDPVQQLSEGMESLKVERSSSERQ